MAAAQLNFSGGGAAVSCGSLLNRLNNNLMFSRHNSIGFRSFFGRQRDIGITRVGMRPLSLDRAKGFCNVPVVATRKRVLSRFNSDSGLQEQDHDVEEESCSSPDEFLQLNSNGVIDGLNGTVSSWDKEDRLLESSPSTPERVDVKKEVIMLSLPAIGGQAIDPLVQLMETAYIGRMGSVELASAGVSISLFNIITKLFNIPLLSVATSFVAEDISKNASKSSPSGKLQLSSVSTALVLAVCIGIIEATALSLGSGPLLSLMGISPVSPMRGAAQKFLLLRALGAPAFVVSLALQGIFRGFKDTKTPVFCLGFGNFTAVLLFPFFIYYCKLGVYGAAISTVISQYIVTISMIWKLNKRAVLLPPKLKDLKFGVYMKSGGFLIGRTIASVLTVTLGTSMAARQGPIAMSAHQICLQVWLAVSLLTDALAASAQALISSYISKEDYKTVKDIALFVLKISVVTGISLAVVLGFSFSSLTQIFTKDVQVLDIAKTGVLFVSLSQPLNSLAFIFDGLHYGVSDFPYAAKSMMLVGAISSVFLLYAPRMLGLPGVWLGLTMFMGLRMVAGFVRLLDRKGPWWFLHSDIKEHKEISQIENTSGSLIHLVPQTITTVKNVSESPVPPSQAKAMNVSESSTWDPQPVTMVIGPQFCKGDPMELRIIHEPHFPSLQGDFEVNDVNGNKIFIVEAGRSLFSTRRALYDASGVPIINFQEHPWSTYRWDCYRGESEDPKDLLFSVKDSSFLTTKVDVFLASNTSKEVPDFRIRETVKWFETIINVFAGNSGSIVAKVQAIVTWETMFTNTYGVSVCANVDYAFIVALAVILDHTNRKIVSDD